MERTRNSRVNPLTCDLESRCSRRGTFEESLMKIIQRIQEILSRHELNGKSHDFELWP